MNIYVNNDLLNVQKNATLQSLLKKLAIDDRGMAVAVNNTVIQKTNWPTLELTENDKITLIRATAGG